MNLSSQHTKFDELLRELESNPAHKDELERARVDVAAFFEHIGVCNQIIRDAIHSVILNELVDDLKVHAPGDLAARLTKLLIGPIRELVADKRLAPKPLSTATKIEL